MSSSRPVTPNQHRRRSNRSSGAQILSQSPKVHYPVDANNLPLESYLLSEKFARLSDSIEELDVNMTNLQQIHEVLSSNFNESFASFMYGVSITMWCVDFPGCPSHKTWQQIQDNKDREMRIQNIREQLKLSKEQNEHLKQRLSELSKGSSANRVVESKRSFRSTPTRPVIAARNQPKQLKSTISQRSLGRSDHVNTGSSLNANNLQGTKQNNRLSRIPQPPPRNTYGSQSEVTVTSNKPSPNLNQPPRYLRGLFDSSNTPTTRIPYSKSPTYTNNYNMRRVTKPVRVSKIADRPPFR